MSNTSHHSFWRRTLACVTFAAVTLAGCGHAGHHARTSTSSSVAAQADGDGPGALLAEVQRELAAMRITRYQHTTRVEEATGSYFYDCSGMLDYAAGRVLPDASHALPVSTSVRPLAGDIERYLHQGLSGPIDGWQAVPHVDGLRPGDVVAWQATEDSTTGDTGHVMVVMAAPTRNPARESEWLVTVADSTLNPHADDSRRNGQTGLGTGTIGLTTDDVGTPVAFYWQGAVSKRSKVTEIALGRPT
jgi:hypothetical protein